MYHTATITMSEIKTTSSATTSTTGKLGFKKRGPKTTPKRTRCNPRQGRAMKRLVSQIQTLKGRDLTLAERGAAAGLCEPFVRESSGGR